MRLTTTTIVLVVTASILGAQEQVTKPYEEGDVQAFLARARVKSRPAIVLFNFNLESG